MYKVRPLDDLIKYKIYSSINNTNFENFDDDDICVSHEKLVFQNRVPRRTVSTTQ